MRIDPDAPWLRRLGDSFLAGIMEEALRRDPRDEEAIAILAHLRTKEGRIEEGLALDRRLAALRPEDPVVRYNLACSLALSGQREEALAALAAAAVLGWDDAAHAREDGDLHSLRGDPRFEELLRGMEGGGPP